MSDIPTDRDELDEQYTSDQLAAGPATELDITGRWDMSKEDLMDAVLAAADTETDFGDVHDVEEGDIVEMNHLENPLEVTDVEEVDDGVDVVMKTGYGGRHKFCFRQEGDSHLRRWRAGDETWMMNSEDPTYFRINE